MTRWHSPSCKFPIVWVGDDSVPRCKACGASAREQLQQLRASPSDPTPSLPPDEQAGQLNLYWPSSVTYTRSQTAALEEEIPGSLQISNTPSRTQKSFIYERALAKDEFRLICLTPEEKDSPEDVVHLSLETYNDGNFPDYEAVSYTWGGEDGDDTLRHPVYIGEHWDFLPQTRNCCAMLRYLRPWGGIRMVWVDAICINQEDIQERGDQVAKMGQIYAGCVQVFLWLGEDMAFGKPGVHPPRLPLHELENLEELQFPGKTERVNIPSLLERRYFSRVWIIQELILPPRIAIPIGDKIFWADPSTATHFERLSGRDWLWEHTRAPWFQHATRGSVMQENLSEFMTLTWKSQSSDVRDKVYGVMGLYIMKEGAQIRPNYGISVQHLIIGFFAHGIISGGAPQLLLKAAGTSADPGMPSWMPLWRGDAWKELFRSNDKEDPDWEDVKNFLVAVKSRRQKPEDMTLAFRTGLVQHRLVGFLPGSFFLGENDSSKTVFDRRPWYQNATVDADTGAMSLNLTRLVSAKDRLVRIDRLSGEDGCYKISNAGRFSSDDCILIMSQDRLDRLVKAGDDIFLLDTNVGTPIYLILRKTHSPGEFLLVAACPQLVFFCERSRFEIFLGLEKLHLGHLQGSLHDDLTRLRGFYEHEVPGETKDEYQGIRKRFLFPGRRGPVLFKEVLPLLLGIARDKHKRKFKSWRGFQELYLESIDSKFQPRVSNGACELLLDAGDNEEIGNLGDCLVVDDPSLGPAQEVKRKAAQMGDMTGMRVIRMKGWTKFPAQEDKGKVVLKRHMSVIGTELRTMVSNWSDLNGSHPVMLLDSLVDRLDDEDVGERIMAEPVEEDHFRCGTHFGLDPVFERFGLDGSTFRVRII